MHVQRGSMCLVREIFVFGYHKIFIPSILHIVLFHGHFSFLFLQTKTQFDSLLRCPAGLKRYGDGSACNGYSQTGVTNNLDLLGSTNSPSTGSGATSYSSFAAAASACDGNSVCEGVTFKHTDGGIYDSCGGVTGTFYTWKTGDPINVHHNCRRSTWHTWKKTADGDNRCDLGYCHSNPNSGMSACNQPTSSPGQSSVVVDEDVFTFSTSGSTIGGTESGCTYSANPCVW